MEPAGAPAVLHERRWGGWQWRRGGRAGRPPHAETRRAWRQRRPPATWETPLGRKGRGRGQERGGKGKRKERPRGGGGCRGGPGGGGGGAPGGEGGGGGGGVAAAAPAGGEAEPPATSGAGVGGNAPGGGCWDAHLGRIWERRRFDSRASSAAGASLPRAWRAKGVPSDTIAAPQDSFLTIVVEELVTGALVMSTDLLSQVSVSS